MKVIGIDIGGTKTIIGIVDIKKVKLLKKYQFHQNNLKMIKKT